MFLNGANVEIHGLFQAWFSSTEHLNMQNDQNLDDGSWPFLERNFQKHISAIFAALLPHTADADGAGSAGCFCIHPLLSPHFSSLEALSEPFSSQEDLSKLQRTRVSFWQRKTETLEHSRT